MKINSIKILNSQNKTTSFNGAQHLSTILPNTPVKNKVAPLSQAIFKQYLSALKLPKINLSLEELRKLFAIKDNDVFLENGFNLLLKKLNIPDKIAPELTYANVQSNWSFGYDRFTNKIIVNTLYDLPSKEEILVLLRHELQHYLQNINLYRQEKIKKDYLSHNLDLYFNDYTKLLLKTLEKSPEEWNVDKKRLKKLSTYKKYLDEGNHTSFNKKLQAEKEKVRKSLKMFQRDIIKALGSSNSGTKKAQNNEQIYQAILNYGRNQEMSWGEYLTNPAEYEATLSEYLLESELYNTCFMKFLKEKYQNFINSKDPENLMINSEIAEILKEKPNTNFILPNSLG